MKKIISFTRKLGHWYTEGFKKLYGPAIEAGVCPWI